MTIYGAGNGLPWTLEQKRYRYRVRAAVGYAVMRGDLPKLALMACPCGDPATEYHHDDYGIPLGVRPLCKECHILWHKANGHGRVPDELPDLTGMFSKIRHPQATRSDTSD